MYIKFKKDEKHIEFKDGDERNELSDDLDAFDDAGYVLTDHDIVVDIDDLSQEQVQTLIDTFNISTETVWSNKGEHEGHHGVHLYFTKPTGFRAKDGICALGFPVEYKHTPSSKYVTVKRHGNARRVTNAGRRQELPEIFYPRPRGEYKNMLEYGAGDGRNNALFSHRVAIMDIPHWRKVIDFINNELFDEPLPSTEVDHLSREIDIIAEKDNQFEMASMFLREYNIVKYNGLIFFRQGRGYENDEAILERLVWSKCEGMTSRYVNEILAQIEGRARLIDKDTLFPVKFNNGILQDGEFIQMEYDDFTPYNINIDYLPDAKPVEAVDDYLDHLTGGDENYRLFIGEILGHILIRDRYVKNTMPYAFFFVGGGGNGKGTLLRIIEQIVQVQNTSQLDIQQLTDERYLITINNMLVNLGDDVEDKAINTREMKIIKNISSCDTIQMRKLFEVSKTVVPTTTLIFTTNHIIKSFEKGDSVKRRMKWCPMYTKVTEYDPNFITNITTHEALEYWVRLMIEGYQRLYKNGDMTANDPVDLETKRYHEENNQSNIFLGDLTLEDVENFKPKDVYDRYLQWCEEDGTEPTSQRIFRNNIEELFDVDVKVKWLNGQSHRVYVTQEELNADRESTPERAG